MKKILHVVDSLGRGGAEVFLLRLLPELRNQGVHCDILYLSEPGTLSPEFESQGVSVHFVSGRGLQKVLRVLRALRQLKRENSYTTFHAHLFWSTWYVALYSLFSRFPILVTFHNLEFDLYPVTTFRRRCRRFLFGSLLRCCNGRFTAVSAASARSYTAHCRVEDIKVLPVAVDVACLPARRESVAKAEKEFKLSLVANLKFGKGHSVLLEAIRRLRALDEELATRVRVQFIGAGPLVGELREHVQRLGLGDQVWFLGEQTPVRTLEIVSNSDLMVLPSFSEGLPVSVLEALGMGVPVVASRVGGIPEVIENGVNGVLVEPGDSEELANAIASLMRDRAFSVKLGDSGRVCVLKKYDLPVVSRAWAALYRSEV